MFLCVGWYYQVFLDCWNDVWFHVVSCFMTTSWVQLDIFQPSMPLTIESPSMTVTGSLLLSGVLLSVLSFKFCMFWVAVLIAFCFAVAFVFSKSVLAFSFSVGLSSISNGEWRFFVSIGCVSLDRFFYIGSLLALEIPDFAGISSCRILFFICITSFFLLLQLFSLVGASNSVVSFSCYVSKRLLCCNKESISFCLVPISTFKILFSVPRSFILSFSFSFSPLCWLPMVSILNFYQV